MKATEYYDKFIGSIFLDATDVVKLLTEFNLEAKGICIKRKTQKNEAVIAVLREQNGKWNALRRIFMAKNNGVSPILEDGFKRYWLKQMPQFAEMWK
jgi:hypothetical protein